MIIEAFVLAVITAMIILILLNVFDKEGFIFSVIMTVIDMSILYILISVWMML